MDPISTALIAAAVAGVSSGIGAVSSQFVVDAYNSLKTALIARFGQDGDLPSAINKLEQNPESKGRRGDVEDKVKNANVEEDPELMVLAEALTKALEESAGGRRALGIVVHAQDSQIGIVGQDVKHEGDIRFSSKPDSN